MSFTVLIVGTLDTKGAETAFLKEQIEQRGNAVVVMDVGVLGEAPFVPDILRSEVAAAAQEEVAALGA